MKKALIILGLVLALMGVFLGALAVFVRARGGLSPTYEGVCKIPLVGGLLTGAAPAESSKAAPAAPEDSQGQSLAVSFLESARREPLELLVEELERKKTDYDKMMLELRRSEREAEAWQLELKNEREALREHFTGERADLVSLRGELQDRQAALEALQVSISRREESNLQRMAEVYGKMDAEKGAEIMQELCAKGEMDTVT